jgi:very-short-patch-repair endonuclease
VDRGRLGQNIPKTELETKFLAFLDEHKIPRPLVNKPIGPYTVDGLYKPQRLVVELAAAAPTRPPRRFERDRARDRDLLTKGYRVVRITWHHLHEDELALATQLRALLAA